MSLWSDTQRLKEIAVAVLVSIIVGFGLGRSRYRGKMVPRW